MKRLQQSGDDYKDRGRLPVLETQEDGSIVLTNDTE